MACFLGFVPPLKDVEKDEILSGFHGFFFRKLNKKLAWMIRSQIILIVVMLNKHADTFSLPKVVVYSCSKIG